MAGWRASAGIGEHREIEACRRQIGAGKIDAGQIAARQFGAGSRMAAAFDPGHVVVQALTQHAGVEKVFAIQAGREIRVLVTPDDVDDLRMASLSEEIARRIESDPLVLVAVIVVVVVTVGFAVVFALADQQQASGSVAVRCSGRSPPAS